MKLIDKDKVVTELEKRRKSNSKNKLNLPAAFEDNYLLSFLDTIEEKEVDLENNGWVDCTKRMPPEEKQYSDTLQGHREWTESDTVLVWDSMYGCGIDSTRNGKWRREQRGGYTGQVVHGIIAWRPIPEFNEELL